MGPYTLGEIASRLGGTLRGDAGRRVGGIQPLEEAGPDDLSFVAHPRYRRIAAASRAAGLLASDHDLLPGRNLIIVSNPYAALAEAIALFFPAERPEPGISPQAAIGEGVRMGEGVAIGACAVVGRRSRLGNRVVLMPGVVLGEEVNAEQKGARAKIPQVGNVVVGDDVEIGACTTIDRATFGSTLIGKGTKIDNLVQVGHNVVVGEGSVLVAQSGIAGSTRLGRAVILAGQSGAAGHLTLGDGAVVGAKSAALQDLPAGAFVLGIPAIEHRGWKRSQAALRRLPELLHRVARLERLLAAGAEAASAGGAARKVAARTRRRARRRSG